MKTQKQRVLEMLLRDGSVDNFWAIRNYILRLGARIHDIRADGYKIIGKFGSELKLHKKYHKNFYYILQK
jgi:hypothetical protein